MPENEHLTMRIAEDFGIRVVPSTLIHLQSGEIAYLTKRIDRTESGEKIHMLDMFQITEARDKYKSSYEKIGKAINSYSSNTLLDKILYLELVIFSFLTGNNDMHLKNFSMIESANAWIFSPAYDLLNVSIVIPDDKEELALALVGKKRKLKREHFEQLGIGMGLNEKQITSIFNRMIKNKLKAVKWIEKSFLSKEMKTAYLETLNSRYSQLTLI
jgi:serine/threonine-protein kinase HipA